LVIHSLQPARPQAVTDSEAPAGLDTNAAAESPTPASPQAR
jgi:hypothetical protein